MPQESSSLCMQCVTVLLYLPEENVGVCVCGCVCVCVCVCVMAPQQHVYLGVGSIAGACST